MSKKLETQVWESDLKRDEKVILANLADFGNDDGLGIYPSLDYLAWRTGYNKTWISEILMGCKEKGYIQWQRKGSHVGTNNYRICAEKFPTRPPWSEERAKRLFGKTEELVRENRRTCSGKPNGSVRDPLEIREGASASPEADLLQTDPSLPQPGPGPVPLDQSSVICDDRGRGGETPASPLPPGLSDNLLGIPVIVSDVAPPGEVKIVGEDSTVIVKNVGALSALGRGVERNQEDALRGIDLAGWPDDIAPVVRQFCREWGHRPPVMKKKKAYWITCARQVKAVSGEFGSLALKRLREGFEAYMETHHGLAPYTVKDIGSILGPLESVAAEMRLEAGRKQAREALRHV